MFKLRPDKRHVSEYVGNISALPAYRLVQNVSGFRRELGNGKRSNQYTLEQLLCFLVIFECSNPQDAIYAVLGIASDVQPITNPIAPQSDPTANGAQPNHNPTVPQLEPVLSYSQPNRFARPTFTVDYKETTLQVYKRFLKHAIKQSLSLDILCRPWAPANSSEALGGLPSWILDATRKPFRATSKGKMIRYNPEPLVGPAVNRGSIYSASGRCVEKWDDDWFRFEKDSPDCRVIIVKGFKLADPKEIYDRAVHRSIPDSWLRGAKWDDIKKPPPDELWRTLVADRNSAYYEPEPGCSSTIHKATLEKGVEYGINANELLHEKDNAAYFEVFRRVQAVVWNRKLIRVKLEDETHGMEPLSLAPAQTVEKDEIYILKRCSVALVLRRNGGVYNIIGECYVNNMMDGRALNENCVWDHIKIA
ncbi:hypothetical protein F4802DRAFT_592209 [Xylaria palmicola]|nr:hypothetical protein F4802DRAFT_592209 [Xylaria palmicola]